MSLYHQMLMLWIHPLQPFGLYYSISEADVFGALYSLNPTKAAGIDGIALGLRELCGNNFGNFDIA